MHFTALRLSGAFVIELAPHVDERGLFARTWCRDEFAARGLNTDWPQSSVSFNRSKGTLRGMHFQAEPHAEIKLIRCTMGAAFDVIVDLRADSPTYRQWEAIELTAENRRSLYVPKGFAHGFQTLVDATELFYQMSARYQVDAARGVRWDDPTLAIEWPAAERRIISAADRCYPDLGQ